jgi:hypothetical protein
MTKEILVLTDLVSIEEDIWTLDPKKISSRGLFSFLVADRMGSEEIGEIIIETDMQNENCSYYYQEKLELICVANNKIDNNFYEYIGKNYYKNRFLAVGGRVIIWLPDFSEFSVVVTNRDTFAQIKHFVAGSMKDFEEWKRSDFWTEGEKKFLESGFKKYSILT